MGSRAGLAATLSRREQDQASPKLLLCSLSPSGQSGEHSIVQPRAAAVQCPGSTPIESQEHHGLGNLGLKTVHPRVSRYLDRWIRIPGRARRKRAHTPIGQEQSHIPSPTRQGRAQVCQYRVGRSEVKSKQCCDWLNAPDGGLGVSLRRSCFFGSRGVTRSNQLSGLVAVEPIG